ncbi:MAG: hypothetical protein IKC52_02635 [Clostridia bacterium]|nr:hypothetical protein [Clostridia bacterium]
MFSVNGVIVFAKSAVVVVEQATFKCVATETFCQQLPFAVSNHKVANATLQQNLQRLFLKLAQFFSLATNDVSTFSQPSLLNCQIEM